MGWVLRKAEEPTNTLIFKLNRIDQANLGSSCVDINLRSQLAPWLLVTLIGGDSEGASSSSSVVGLLEE